MILLADVDALDILERKDHPPDGNLVHQTTLDNWMSHPVEFPMWNRSRRHSLEGGSASVLIWCLLCPLADLVSRLYQGGQRTKKVAQVEDKLRSALGVVEEEVDPSSGLAKAEQKVVGNGEEMEMSEDAGQSSRGDVSLKEGRGSLTEVMERSSSDVRLGREAV